MTPAGRRIAGSGARHAATFGRGVLIACRTIVSRATGKTASRMNADTVVLSSATALSMTRKLLSETLDQSIVPFGSGIFSAPLDAPVSHAITLEHGNRS